MPGDQIKRGAVAGERLSAGMVGWLSERKSNLRTPGARCRVGSQNVVDSGQLEQSKRVGVLGKDQVCVWEVSGEVAQAKVLV
jgi:hypothetical protein